MTHFPFQLVHADSLHFIKRLRAVCLASALILSALMGNLRADEFSQQATRKQLQYFESKVRPLLVKHCFRCHSGRQQKGGLRLDSRDGMLSGGESGPAIVPGAADHSLLVEAIQYESFEMPPAGQLEEMDRNILKTWIAAGAFWPQPQTPQRGHSHPDADLFTTEELEWWAFQPVQPQPLPAVSETAAAWARNPIDHFVAAEMERRGLTPAAEAAPVTLLRRVYFDLTGLPPTPAEVETYLADTRPDRFERVVDQLLDSPRYGERWARHWLDLVRYADSDGYRADFYRPNAWRYRDYVIDSFNADKPWDRFVQEQLAGDELFPDAPDATVGTAYLRHGIYEYNNRDVRGQWDIILNELTDVTGDAFLGLGMQCARCHDHKFDPILQQDYFALRAFFEPIQWRDGIVIASAKQQAAYQAKQDEWERATADLRRQIDELTASYRAKARQKAIVMFPDDIEELIAKPREDRTPLEQQLKELAWRQVLFEYDRLDNSIKGDDKEQLLALRKQLSAFDHLKPKPLPVADGAGDVSASAPPTTIPKKGTRVNAGFLTVMAPPEPTLEPNGQATTGRRAALARWITDPGNPLTTRVIVNRIWQYHFGRGLAPNSSDLGTLGGPPSHPELLDWLTRQFIDNGLTLKSLHRLVVTSATWRQSAAHARMDQYQEIDPSNRYLWRGTAHRLDAEQIRDAILLATGQLDLTSGGPGVQSDVPRRSIYLRVMRNERDSLLDAFDLPLFFNSTASRDSTTSPIQSLVLFNSQIMLQHAAAMANSIDKTTPLTEQITTAWQRAFGRRPDSHELNQATRFVNEHARLIRDERGDARLTSLPVGRLPYRSGQSILLDPESESLPRLMSPSTTELGLSDFTIEAYFQVRSVYESGAVRTIASKWNGSSKTSGWSFGVTGKGSRRKPQTLVMQIFGRDDKDQLVESAVFSDQHVALNTPYYAAIVVRLGKEGKGSVTFYLKDLSNDDEPVNRVVMPHKARSLPDNQLPVTIGARSTGPNGIFDGLIDDIRLSSIALREDQLLYSSEEPLASTTTWWRFEPEPGVFRDSSGNDHHIQVGRRGQAMLTPEEMAFIDFCHALLNSNQFLYVD